MHDMRFAGATLAEQQQMMHSAFFGWFGSVFIGLVTHLREASDEQRLVFVETLVLRQLLHKIFDEGAWRSIDTLLAEGAAIGRDVMEYLVQEDSSMI